MRIHSAVTKSAYGWGIELTSPWWLGGSDAEFQKFATNRILGQLAWELKPDIAIGFSALSFESPTPLTEETEACSILRCTKYKEHRLQYALETERSLFNADSNRFDCIAIVNNLNLIDSVEIGTVWIIGRLACRWRDGVVRKRLLPPVIGCMCGMAGYINVLSIDTSI